MAIKDLVVHICPPVHHHIFSINHKPKEYAETHPQRYHIF